MLLKTTVEDGTILAKDSGRSYSAVAKDGWKRYSDVAKDS